MLRHCAKSSDITPVGVVWIAGVRRAMFLPLRHLATCERLEGRRRAGLIQPGTRILGG